MSTRRTWTFSPLVAGIPTWRRREIAQWRLWLLDALQSESLDDGPRPSDLHTGER